MNRVFALLTAVATAALLGAGCGGGDGTTDETTTLSRAEFVKKGNAICAAGTQEVNEEFEKFAKENGIDNSHPPTQAQLKEAAEGFLIPSIGRQIEEVAALGAPQGEEEQFDRFISNAEAELEKGEEDPGLMTAENSDLFEGVNEEARAIGLTACAEGA